MPPSSRSIVLAIVTVAALMALAAPAGAQSIPPGTTRPAGARLSVPLFSARRVPDVLRAPVADAALGEQVRAVMAEAPETSCITVSFAGRFVSRVNGALPLVPASVNKLVTATAILRHARPDEKVTTTAVAAAPPQNGVVAGNLWVVGGGDALLTTAGYKPTLKDQQQLVVDYAALADAVAGTGMKEIQGDVVGDESRYDDQRYVPTWPDRYRGQDTVGPLSALVVNDGSSGYDKTPDVPTRVRKPGDPGILAAATFKALLEARGVHATGNGTAGRAPEKPSEIAAISSTIADQVGEMLSWSDNTTAELLTKEVGRRAKGSGSTTAGTEAARAVLDEYHLPTAGVTLVDGSGLDEGNRLTCDLLVGLLDHAGLDSVIARGMPVAGRKGTLARHMRGTVGEGNVIAKTGTLGTVTSLAGWEKTKQGGTVTFAFIQNGLKINTDLQTRLAEALYTYPQAPDLSDLAPPVGAAAS